MRIATRNLTLNSDAQQRIEVALFAPELTDAMWICRYTIGWPDRTRESFAAGFDAVQALHLVLQKIGIDLNASPYHRSGDLRWETAGDGYGFPVPKNGRDMLIGSDKIFDG